MHFATFPQTLLICGDSRGARGGELRNSKDLDWFYLEPVLLASEEEQRLNGAYSTFARKRPYETRNPLRL